LASAVPSAALAAVLIVAVYWVLLASALLGVKVAVVQGLLQLTLAATALLPGRSEERRVGEEGGSRAWEKLEVKATLVARLLALLAGVVMRAGHVAGVLACVLLFLLASAVPSAALAAVLIVAVYWVLLASALLGVKVAVVQGLLQLTLAATALLPG